jgi:antitoxin ParD1/3/4
MNVSLTPQLERFVQAKVESGLYNNASEVVREGLRLLKEQDEIRLKMRDQLERGWTAVQVDHLMKGARSAAKGQTPHSPAGKKRRSARRS